MNRFQLIIVTFIFFVFLYSDKTIQADTFPAKITDEKWVELGKIKKNIGNLRFSVPWSLENGVYFQILGSQGEESRNLYLWINKQNGGVWLRKGKEKLVGVEFCQPKKESWLLLIQPP